MRRYELTSIAAPDGRTVLCHGRYSADPNLEVVVRFCGDDGAGVSGEAKALAYAAAFGFDEGQRLVRELMPEFALTGDELFALAS
jgi:hypothetical protein